jgi:hypothetical protein
MSPPDTRSTGFFMDAHKAEAEKRILPSGLGLLNPDGRLPPYVG